MAAWDRQTPWRQGHALTNEAAADLGLVRAEETATTVVVVISHDCDVVQSPELEPHIEVISGLRVEEADGNYTHAKNPRRLHLPFKQNGSTIYLDLRAKDKHPVSKDEFAAYLPNAHITLSPKDRTVLQRWLAARYHRSAFSDEFIRRLNETHLQERIAKVIEPLGTYLIALFFDVDEGEEVDRKGADDPYKLRIYLLYSTEHDPIAALNAAEDAGETISGAFRERCFISGKGWQWIELLDCEPISDEAMTYALSVQLKRWNADYLSLRAEPGTGPLHSE